MYRVVQIYPILVMQYQFVCFILTLYFGSFNLNPQNLGYLLVLEINLAGLHALHASSDDEEQLSDVRSETEFRQSIR